MNQSKLKIHIVCFLILLVSSCDTLLGGLRTEVSRKDNKVYFVFEERTVVDEFSVVDKNNREYMWKFNCETPIRLDSGTRLEYGTPFQGCIANTKKVKPLKKGGSYQAAYMGPSVVYMGDDHFNY